MNKKLFIIFTIILIVGIIYGFRHQLIAKVFSPNSTNIQKGVSSEETDDFEVIAENLEIPWEIAFLPTGEILITERPGRLLKIGVDRKIIEVDGVAHVGEGGLLGMALHPNFSQNKWIYLYLTSAEGELLVNKVERYRLENNNLVNRKIIVGEIPGAKYHDGGRIEFGPEGYLYIATGDAGDEEEAQNKNSLNGTILRVKDDGSIPDENPFGTLVYSYGHRNVQGLAWDDEGQLWATEHGRSGVKSGLDELNLIKMGNNYGWPLIEGDETGEGLVQPIINSGGNDTWAPAGAEFIGGSIFFAGLRGEALYEAVLDGEKAVELKMHFREELGRLRAVRIGPDGYLYITTSNRDGRGKVNDGDDKLIRINPKVFDEN